jgi:hypothetical protein
VNGPLFQYNSVYYVESSGDKILNPVAIRPEIFKDRIQWLDTNRGTIIKLGKIDNLDLINGQSSPELIEITSAREDHYRLIKLTLDIYNNQVTSRVANPPSFGSDEEVQNFYLNTDFES